MIAWQMFANGATPEGLHQKGDHLVGDYYVKFNEVYKSEVEEMVKAGVKKETAEKEAPIMKKTQEMLLQWEHGNPEVRQLWAKMNNWVYRGFDETYRRIGSDFDHTFYESNTYLLGKDFVQEGLQKNILFKKEDGSVWIDLSDKNLDEKLVLRGDGTSVYITQDIGLAKQKFEEFHLDKSIYVIGDEQLHHMKVLKEILRKLGMPFADKMFHLSYGMVELTTGRMKSREGTVVDADDLLDEMVATAARHTEELGKVKDFTKEELEDLYETLGLGAMKFYLLRVDPKKRMIFNPEESIDFHGFTGPFVQYTFARIQSILRKVSEETHAIQHEKPALESDGIPKAGEPFAIDVQKTATGNLLPLERQLILFLEKYGNTISEAAAEMNPSVIANYAFNLAKLFNLFYVEHSVLNAESEEKKILRLRLSVMVANVIKSALELLGIKVPERM
jgi:arginyl-tRNA synthetase